MMKMEKTATTIKEQICKLKSRGMQIDDVQKAEENLLDIGYFRLGFYWFPFEKSYPRKTERDHCFREGTKFDYAMRLYYFDFDLRNLFLRYISRIEVNCRTTLTYYVSNKYKNDPFWYINPKVVKQSLIDSEKFQTAIRDMKKEPVIKQDLRRHKRDYPPAWKALEFMSFGTIISIYDNLIDGGLRHQISVVYGMEAPSQFSNYINTVRRLRNACAHSKVLFDLHLPEAISNGPLGDLKSRKTMLSGAYMVFKYLLERISKNRAHEMQSGLIVAFDRVTDTIVKDIIIENSGFDIENL